MKRSLVRKLSTSLVLSAVLLSFAESALADSANSVKIFTGRPPAAEELANMMFPERALAKEPAVPAIRTRAIVLNDSSPPRLAPTERPQGFGFLINFAFNSSKILPESRPYLDQVGEMLRLDYLAGERIVIEGHTDASGSERYNRKLSEKRAESVKSYLMNNHGVVSARLVVAGKGESELLSGRNPRDAMNRRVQFQRLY